MVYPLLTSAAGNGLIERESPNAAIPASTGKYSLLAIPRDSALCLARSQAIRVVGLLCSPISINSAKEYGCDASRLAILVSGAARPAQSAAACGVEAIEEHCPRQVPVSDNPSIIPRRTPPKRRRQRRIAESRPQKP